MMLATLFTLTSTLNLASVLRDRFDAEVWLLQYESTPYDMVDVCLTSTMEMAMATLQQMKMLFASLMGMVFQI